MLRPETEFQLEIINRQLESKTPDELRAIINAMAVKGIWQELQACQWHDKAVKYKRWAIFFAVNWLLLCAGMAWVATR